MDSGEHIGRAFQLAKDASSQTWGYIKEHPGAAAAFGTGAVCVAGPGLVAAPLLGAAGFSATGIQAGSLAAAVQSGLGSVVAPGLFATLQSAAMGGYGVPAVLGVVKGAGGAILAGSTARGALWGKKHDRADGGDEAEGQQEEEGSGDGVDDERSEGEAESQPQVAE
ncbi:hypothetical protein CDD83_5235 [Cordyceps sp. RAO-2017]|nr:hypothetical protein CDD83_5235 [Cordyceps sp. RAO-2017]